MDSYLPNHPAHPKHCFCQIPDDELRRWAFKRYKEHLSTLELLNSTNDPHEKEVICVVSMLDVDEATMLDMMGDVAMPQHHIIHCRQKVRKILGIEPEKTGPKA